MNNNPFPDLQIILSEELVVIDMLFYSGYKELLLNDSDVQFEMPLEFILTSELSEIIRFKIEKCNNQFPIEAFVYVSENKFSYEVRVFKDKYKNKPLIICSIRNLSGILKTNKNLTDIAYLDTLTSLPNRTHYYRKLLQTMAYCKKDKVIFGLIFFDLDRFKNINDSLGHPVGDELLAMISYRIKSNLMSNEYIARISGDEFIVIVNQVNDDTEVIETAQRILSMFKVDFQLTQHLINVKPSIGVSLYPKHSQDIDELTQFADTAMYQAKDYGGNQIVIFDKKQNSMVKNNFQLDQDLRRAIKNHEIYLVYQPQFCCKSKNIIGLESLVRWKKSENQHISPDRFIKIAELTGYINELGLWIINQVCAQIKIWKDNNIDFKKIAINLSRKQVVDPDLVDSVFAVMKFHGIMSSEIVFEITEDSIIKNRTLALQNLHRLNDAGIKISIDDFGFGYSSFVDLKNFPFSELKIDKSITDDIGKSAENDAIVKTIITLGSELKLLIIAEGVETTDQFEFLSKNNCPYVQGYYLAKPDIYSEIEKIL